MASSVGGVLIPEGLSGSPSALTNDPILTNIPRAPTPTTGGNLVGGIDAGSVLNQGGSTSKSEMTTANSASSTVAVQSVSPATKFGDVLQKTEAGGAGKGVTADWYRDGKLKEKKNPDQPIAYERLAKTIAPWVNEQAVIKVYGRDKASNKDVELIPGYTKLILESVQESHQERSQIVETFGDFYVFLYGERPPMYNFSGTLINTKNYNWVSDFIFYYENFLRGTKCVEQNARIVMMYGGRMIEGFMLGMSMATDAILEAGVKVSFSLVVTDRKLLSKSDDFGYVSINGQMMKTDAFKDLLEKVAGSSGAGSSSSAISAATNAAQSVLSGGPAAGLLRV